MRFLCCALFQAGVEADRPFVPVIDTGGKAENQAVVEAIMAVVGRCLVPEPCDRPSIDSIIDTLQTVQAQCLATVAPPPVPTVPPLLPLTTAYSCTLLPSACFCAQSSGGGAVVAVAVLVGTDSVSRHGALPCVCACMCLYVTIFSGCVACVACVRHAACPKRLQRRASRSMRTWPRQLRPATTRTHRPWLSTPPLLL